MWPLLLLIFGVGGGCALNTSGQGAPDVSDAVDEAGDAIIPDIFDAVDEVSDDLPEFIVETSDADDASDADDVYVPDSTDDGEVTDPCVGNLPPRSFHLLSPSPGATGVSTRTVFEWGVSIDPEGGPVEYTLSYDDDGDPLTPSRVISPLTANRLELASDDAVPFGAAVAWEVTATDRCGAETEGISPRSFTTREYPVCTKLGADLRVTNAGGDSLDPSLVWSGSEYGLSWYDNRDSNYEIYFRRISGTGAFTGSEVRVTNALGNSRGPSLVWNGSEYAVGWCDNRDGADDNIYFQRVSSSGTLVGANVRVTNDPRGSKFPSMVWADGEYGVSWHDYRDGNREIYFRRTSESGVPLGSDIRITSAINDSWYTSLAWTGSEYGVGWYDNRDGENEIYFRRISESGMPLGSDVRVTDTGDSRRPAVVWAGDEYGIIWHDDRDGNYEIYFARLSDIGMLLAAEIRVTNDAHSSQSPVMAWTGHDYGIAWQDDRDGNSEIYFKWMADAGSVWGEDIRVTNAAGESSAPSLAPNDDEFAISWNDGRDGNQEIYFARIGCEP